MSDELNALSAEDANRLVQAWQHELVSTADALRLVLHDLDLAREKGPPEWLIPPSVAERQALRYQRDAYRTALLAANARRRAAPGEREERGATGKVVAAAREMLAKLEALQDAVDHAPRVAGFKRLPREQRESGEHKALRDALAGLDAAPAERSEARDRDPCKCGAVHLDWFTGTHTTITGEGTTDHTREACSFQPEPARSEGTADSGGEARRAEPVCVCGHPKTAHFRGGPCLTGNERECACEKFCPAPAPTTPAPDPHPCAPCERYAGEGRCNLFRTVDDRPRAVSFRCNAFTSAAPPATPAESGRSGRCPRCGLGMNNGGRLDHRGDSAEVHICSAPAGTTTDGGEL